MTAPVVLFVFNRPEHTRRATERLAAIAPRRLLVVADGPRNAEEAVACDETRRALREGIDWQADVEFLESDTNLGCRRRIESGMDWAFERVDRAIVLEDDIEVAPAFFAFATSALERFETTEKVRMLCAHNALLEYPDLARPFLARTGSIWGWATWADRWRAYRRGFAAATRSELHEGIATHASCPVHARLQQHLLGARLWETIDTWDMPWSLWILATGGACLTVPRNLASNHGLGRGATHTTAEDDVRACWPLRPWPPDYGSAPGASLPGHRTQDDDLPPLLDEYDRAFTLLEIAFNYDRPRRWKVLASRRRSLPAPASGPGWELMLAPFDHAGETAHWLAHLARWIGGPHLESLREIFPPEEATP